MSELVLEMRGGLGNQMFQAAAALALADRFGREPVLDFALLSRAGLAHVRPDLLDVFPALREIRRRGVSARAPRRVRRIARRLQPRYDEPEGLIGFDPGVLNARRARYFSGYFMSWRYFGSGKRDPRRLFRVDPAFASPWFREESHLLERERPIALHVRLGDYRMHAPTYGALGPDYYSRAVAWTRRYTGARPVWLFSDEPSAAAEILDAAAFDFRVVRSPAGESPASSLMLMAGASAVVGANSSFSWWAAYLGSPRFRPVVFPSPHFASGPFNEPTDYYPSTWQRLTR